MSGAGIALALLHGMPRVLIVDDCRDVAAILSRYLTGAGYVVTVVHDGAQFLASLKHPPLPDCVLLDLMLPVISGAELLQHLRQDDSTAHIPVVLVSARVGEGRAHVFNERDADYCVGKPFTRAQVLAAVDAAICSRTEGERAVRGDLFADDLFAPACRPAAVAPARQPGLAPVRRPAKIASIVRSR